MFHRENNVLRRGTGVAVEGATVKVYVTGTDTAGDYTAATLATIYPANVVAAAIAGSALTSDENGHYEYYAPDGVYDEVLTYGSITEVDSYIQMFDLAEFESSSAADAAAAAASAAAAGGSAVNAAASAAAAATSETNAANSAAAAAASSTTAGTARDAAVTAELASEASANASETSRSSAAVSETNAAASATAAAASAASIASLGPLHIVGSTDCSANPNYPAAGKGDAYVVSVAGKIGGAAGVSVDVGDLYVATAANAGGTQAGVGASWTSLEHNAVFGAGSAITAKDEGSTLTASMTSVDFVGAGVVATNVGGAVTVTVAGAAAGNTWKIERGPLDNEAPSSSFATLDSRNGHPTLDFDAAAAESAVFTGFMPNDYSGAGITVTLDWAATSATSGNVMWQAAFERLAAAGQDTDADNFASAQAFAASAADGTSGKLTKVSLNVSNGANMGSIAAGDMFRLKITRDAANGSDTMTGDAELMRVMVVSQ